jgi:hypothetical protein
MSTSDTAGDPDLADRCDRATTLAAELETAGEQVTTLHEEVETVGETPLERLADAYRGAERLLDRYEERATDYDDFAGYVEFQETFVEFVEELDEDLPRRAAFEAADDRFQKSRLTEADFEAAREALAPAREGAELLERYRSARETFGERRHEARDLYADLVDRADALERTLALGATDLSVDVAALGEPVEAYDEAVLAAFESFRRTAPSREVLELVAEAADRPFVDFRAPPTRLAEYLGTADVGEEPVPTLLEYADYSASKLSHYVADPGALSRHVATNRTYLNGLDAEPLTIGWPPPPASLVRFAAEEYRPVVAGFADSDVVAKLRTVGRLARDSETYGDRREAAHALAQLGETGRERLESGAVATDLARVRAARDRLRAALDTVTAP